MTFNVVCETDPSAGRDGHETQWRLQQFAQKAWSKFFPGLESTTRQTWEQRWTSLLKGTHLRPPKGWSSWMVARTLTVVAEAAKDCHVLIWNVRRVAGSGSVWEWSLCPETVENIFDSLSLPDTSFSGISLQRTRRLSKTRSLLFSTVCICGTCTTRSLKSPLSTCTPSAT